MRVDLDLDSGIVSLPFDLRLVDPLRVSLADQPLEVRLLRTGSLAQLIPNGNTAASLELIVSDSANNPVVRGKFDLTGQPQTDPAKFPILKCGEDWSTAALVALFAGKKYVDIRGQFRWRDAADVASGKWYNSRLFNVTVASTLYTSALIPGAVVLADMLYISSITRLSGGVYPTDLDSIDISPLADKTIIRVAITGRGESSWRRDTDAGSPATDLDAGTIRPTNYDSVLRPYVLHRQSGY